MVEGGLGGVEGWCGLVEGGVGGFESWCGLGGVGGWSGVEMRRSIEN
jgi:hypothetical protein